MSSLSVEEREKEFNKLCIYPIKGVAKHILYLTEYIYIYWKESKIKHIDSNFNNKQIAYCPDLLSGIISFNIAFSILKR